MGNGIVGRFQPTDQTGYVELRDQLIANKNPHSDEKTNIYMGTVEHGNNLKNQHGFEFVAERAGMFGNAGTKSRRTGVLAHFSKAINNELPEIRMVGKNGEQKRSFGSVVTDHYKKGTLTIRSFQDIDRATSAAFKHKETRAKERGDFNRADEFRLKARIFRDAAANPNKQIGDWRGRAAGAMSMQRALEADLRNVTLNSGQKDIRGMAAGMIDARLGDKFMDGATEANLLKIKAAVGENMPTPRLDHLLNAVKKANEFNDAQAPAVMRPAAWFKGNMANTIDILRDGGMETGAATRVAVGLGQAHVAVENSIQTIGNHLNGVPTAPDTLNRAINELIDHSGKMSDLLAQVETHADNSLGVTNLKDEISRHMLACNDIVATVRANPNDSRTMQAAKTQINIAAGLDERRAMLSAGTPVSLQINAPLPEPQNLFRAANDELTAIYGADRGTTLEALQDDYSKALQDVRNAQVDFGNDASNANLARLNEALTRAKHQNAALTGEVNRLTSRHDPSFYRTKLPEPGTLKKILLAMTACFRDTSAAPENTAVTRSRQALNDSQRTLESQLHTLQKMSLGTREVNLARESALADINSGMVPDPTLYDKTDVDAAFARADENAARQRANQYAAVLPAAIPPSFSVQEENDAEPSFPSLPLSEDEHEPASVYAESISDVDAGTDAARSRLNTLDSAIVPPPAFATNQEMDIDPYAAPIDGARDRDEAPAAGTKHASRPSADPVVIGDDETPLKAQSGSPKVSVGEGDMITVPDLDEEDENAEIDGSDDVTNLDVMSDMMRAMDEEDGAPSDVDEADMQPQPKESLSVIDQALETGDAVYMDPKPQDNVENQTDNDDDDMLDDDEDIMAGIETPKGLDGEKQNDVGDGPQGSTGAESALNNPNIHKDSFVIDESFDEDAVDLSGGVPQNQDQSAPVRNIEAEIAEDMEEIHDAIDQVEAEAAQKTPPSMTENV